MGKLLAVILLLGIMVGIAELAYAVPFSNTILP
jgi:hypothetical protein